MNRRSESLLPVLRQNEYLTGLAGVAVITVGCWFLAPVTGYDAIALVYLLGVLLGAMVLRRTPVLFAAVSSALCWNFLFIPPRFTFHIGKVEDALMFATYFVVAMCVGTLTTRLREREHVAAQLLVAQESERLRKTLLDCVSHELKTPIAAIIVASEALAVAVKHELAFEVLQGARRLNRVVNELLDLTRLESGTVKLKLEWCDLRDLLQSAIEAETDSLNGRVVTLETDADCPLALIDGRLIEQAVSKLIANAARHSKDQGPVSVKGNCQDGKLIIQVEDHGTGLSAGDEKRVFEKFYRGSLTRGGGLGLGLSIACGFVEAHRGAIQARNRPEGGAQFTISLPAQTRSLAEIHSCQPSAAH